MPSHMGDSLGLSDLQSALPPSPPQYTEAIAQRDVKGGDDSNYSYSPWLLRRTSIHVESTPNEALQDGNSSHREITPSVTAPSLRSNDEKKALRSLLTKFGNTSAGDRSGDGRSLPDVRQSRESSNFGMSVFIEASQPSKVYTRERHEMKGLEQAASVKRWSGDGSPAEPWGKLAKVSLHFNPSVNNMRS